MKNIKFINLKTTLLLGLMCMVFVGCERNPSDDIEFATYPNNGDIFIDGFTGGLDYFPYQGSYAETFSVDEETKYKGTASMRFDVPQQDDPLGGYAGAIFRISSPRDLSGFDALTFWAKATENRAINEIGFGQDFGENKFQASINGLQLTTNWRKYVIPIPDPSKLTAEMGMLWFSEGEPDGYTFWIDELQFETLGNLGQPRPAILDGEDVEVTSFIGNTVAIGGLTQTFNLGSGFDQTVEAAPSYFTFSSSNTDVVQINEQGVATVVGEGTAVITAMLGGVKASGSWTVTSLGEFVRAPVPTRNAENVISIFSDAYSNVPVDYYNGYFAPYQTTQGQNDIIINGDNIISYTKLNFVGIGTFLNVSPIDITDMTHLHVDINVQEDLQSGDFIKLEIHNSVGNNETSGAYTIQGSQLLSNGWASLDIPLSSFSGLSSRNQVGLLFFVSDATISNILVDNIYYYKE